MKVDEKKLIQGLKDQKVEKKKIDALVEEAAETNSTLYEVVQRRHLLSDDALGKLIATILDFPYITVANMEIPSEILEIVPENIALKQGIITFGVDEDKNVIKIATTNPIDTDIIHDIEKKTGRSAEVYYTTYSNIKSIIGKYNQELKNIFMAMLPKRLRYLKGDVHSVDEDKVLGEDISIVKIFNAVLLHAFRQQASDVHIEAGGEHTVVRYRIDGVLHTIVKFPRVLHDPIMTRCKILSGLRIDESRAAQDGRMNVTLDGEHVAFRVSVLPTHFGEKIVLRLLVDLEDSVKLYDAGLSKEDYDKVISNSTKPYGMMIVTGPTGSGKTTTLYNVMKLLNSEEMNIATIEDPIEYGIEGVNQVQVNASTNLTFANGLRSLLRQDPDVILVGEIRDQETAQIAVESAMTGHMVFSTLHANTASIAIPRLMEMDIEPFLLSAALNAILAQRLVRRLCQSCIQTYVYTAETLNMIYPSGNLAVLVKEIMLAQYGEETVKELGLEDQFIFYKSIGCNSCGQTGYKGRAGLYEVLEVDDAIKQLMLSNASALEIEKVAIENGMTTMLKNGVEKALSGQTSLEEIIRVIRT